MRRYGILFILGLFYGVPLYAQQPDKITIDLNSSSIKSATFPFDVPFTLTGKPADDCYQITFSYNVSKDELTRHPAIKKWCSLPFKDPVAVYTAPAWKRVGTEAAFYIDCPGMHPDIKYDFTFEILRNVPSDDAYKADLKQKLGAKVQAFFAKQGIDQLTNTQLNTLASDLQGILTTKIFNGQSGLTLQKKENPGKPYKIDVRGTLRNNISVILPASSKIAAANRSITGNALPNLTTNFTLDKDKLSAAIDAVTSKDAKLTDRSVTLLEQPIGSAPDAFKSYTRRAGLLILKKLCQSPDKLNKLINGTALISNNDIQDAKQLDAASVTYLDVLMGDLKSGTILQSPARGTNPFSVGDDLVPALDNISSNVKIITDNKVIITAELDKFPDLTADIVIAQLVSSQTVSATDVITQNTAYISAEGGLGYATAFQAGVSYLGANFYLSPVNKKAKLGDFRGWNRFKKSFCFFVGYTTLYGDRPLHTYSLVGSGNSDFMIGAGWRFGRIIKLGLSGLPYKVSYNPLTDDRTVKISAVISLGIDVNLIGALGGVAKGLKLSN